MKPTTPLFSSARQRCILLGLIFPLLALMAIALVLLFWIDQQKAPEDELLSFTGKVLTEHQPPSDVGNQPQRLYQLERQLTQQRYILDYLLGLDGLQTPAYRNISSDLQRLTPQVAELREILMERPPSQVPAEELERRGNGLLERLGQLYRTLHSRALEASQGYQEQLSDLIKALASIGLAILLTTIGVILIFERVLRRQSGLHRLTLTDELTRLNNRRALLNKSEQALLLAHRYKRPLSLALLDIDYFKRINDRYGHPLGDQVLRQFGQTLSELIRESDVAARVGGEEFCVVMPDTNLEGATRLCERIREGVTEFGFVHKGEIISITVSIGLTHTPGGDKVSFDTLYDRADQALYLAKHNGRNRVEVG
ncbi:GGDEF domain-containing protein [Pistricoccus aurantiacus]|uniref:GGDEF domain-containing protein n=1 Tax=Pistricoccus aurantiacus TaxID=1883414 RepID=UPI003631BED6